MAYLELNKKFLSNLETHKKHAEANGYTKGVAVVDGESPGYYRPTGSAWFDADDQELTFDFEDDDFGVFGSVQIRLDDSTMFAIAEAYREKIMKESRIFNLEE